MTHGELFSGCGGLTLGLERATGARLAWHCQHDPDSRKQPCDEILERHWPGVPNLGDITAVDWHTVEPVDLLAGGFPCQDVSHAGLRAGLADGTRSGLWFQFAAAIRVLRPRVVVVENVPGLLTAGFGVVMADLAEAGYHARWACLRAADVGAPHGRERVFVVATDAERDAERRPRPGEVPRAEGAREGEGAERERLRADAGDGGEALADPGRVRVDTDGRLRRGGAGAPPGSPRAPVSPGSEVARAADTVADRAAVADADDGRREQHDSRLRRVSVAGPGDPSSVADAAGRGWDGEPEREDRDGQERGREAIGPQGDASSADGDRDAGDYLGDAVQWGVYEPAIRRWEQLTRRVPAPTDDRGRLSPEFVEWMLGFPAGWTDGVTRTARLKMLGNAVQVQCAELVGIAAAHWLKESAA